MSKGRKPASCPICAHSARVQITAALQAGEDALAVAQRFAVTTRHLAKHLEHLGAVVVPRRGSISAPEASTPPEAKVAKVIPLRAATCAVCAHP